MAEKCLKNAKNIQIAQISMIFGQDCVVFHEDSESGLQMAPKGNKKAKKCQKSSPAPSPPGARGSIFLSFSALWGNLEARFGILIKNYTILSKNHRNLSYVDPFRAHFSYG